MLVLDIATYRLFRPVRSDSTENPNRNFMKIEFRNKGLDAINISNILNYKDVKAAIPPYFKNQNPLLISYSYTTPIATKIFNYKDVLPRTLLITTLSSKFCYQPAGHVITGDLDIVENKTLRELLLKGPKFREPKSFSWKQNLEIIMNSVGDYAKRWAKEENVEVDTLSE